ncbi:MAG: DUF4340 domain-containing protein, partial [Bdellovibrionales bacterium]|nr:DUF4340 domain-containing protein [Bdellovibrionales bacterium]
MKSFNTTFIFALLVALLGGVAYWDLQRSKEQEQSQLELTKALPHWQQDQVSEIKIVNHDNNEIHLLKKDSSWQVLKPIEDEGDNSSIDGMISSLISDKLKKLNLSEPPDLMKYGLDESKNYIEISSGESKKKILISSKKTFDGQYYLKYASDNNVYLASSTWNQWLNRKVNELRNKKLFTDQERVRKLTVINGKNKMTFEKQDLTWVVNGDKAFKADQNKVSTLVSSVQNFRASDVVAEEKSKDQLKKYNLLKPGLKLIA